MTEVYELAVYLVVLVTIVLGVYLNYLFFWKEET